ncbi:hypothetical protein RND71_026921 [Anisodus tanguticus]|uniref:Interferon-related developmental regulator N-terminal domain-containing protein n=1 Tax=Anisodus tanguticus TaxID=243964 RepID=A0AAE1V496_9SOLA|nr:hypothetical protein RND71_026921 [Anisodus tanguticus]
MGRKSSQRKNGVMLDSDDADSMSSSSTYRSEMIVLGAEEVQVDKEALLDQCVDALYEKRGSTREKALESIIEAFNSDIQHEFVEKKRFSLFTSGVQRSTIALANMTDQLFILGLYACVIVVLWFATLLQQCLNSIKRGSSKEISLASHVLGLLALTAGPGDKAHEMLEESVSPITEALKSRSEASKISSLLGCLAIITFVGGEEPEETEKSMQLMWQVIHPKIGPNKFQPWSLSENSGHQVPATAAETDQPKWWEKNASELSLSSELATGLLETAALPIKVEVATAKPSPPMITSMVSAWSFLLATIGGLALNPKSWQGSISYFSTLLDKDDRAVRIAAGEALALVFEVGSLEKFSVEDKGSSDSSVDEANKSKDVLHIQGLRAKVLNQVRSLSVEAGGKGSAKKDLNSQRNTFRDILEFLEEGYSPENSMKICGDSLTTSTWRQLIHLNFLRHFLGGGFVKHMQENEFLHDVFGVRPKKKLLSGVEHRISGAEKDKNVGYYTAGE